MSSILMEILISGCAVIIFSLGTVHLVLTFVSDKFDPVEPEMKRMLAISKPRLTTETTIWKAWVGFNASHSLGAMLFGSIYLYLALYKLDFFARDLFFQVLGFIVLGSYFFLARTYWFKVPRRGIGLSFIFYCLGLCARWIV